MSLARRSGHPGVTVFLRAVIRELRRYKSVGDRAIAQVADNDLQYRPGGDCNNIAILINHLAGNMVSRFTDMLTTDGEKPDRDRDREFENTSLSRSDLLARWESGWRTVFDAVDRLRDTDLERTVTIRGEEHTVAEALMRQLGHYAYHVGQIVYLAKQRVGDVWQSLSIPRGQSTAYLDQ